jgi:hypothetical protein
MCNSFDKCSCPLCPDDPDAFKRIWYPGEPICTDRRFTQSSIVRNQRQLALNTNNDEFYTGEMLAGLRDGLNDPNQHGIDSSLSLDERKAAIKTWLVQNRGSIKSIKNKGSKPEISNSGGLA